MSFPHRHITEIDIRTPMKKRLNVLRTGPTSSGQLRRRKMARRPTKRSERVSEFLRHPMVIVAATFLLSSVAGIAFKTWIDSQNLAIQHQEQELAESKQVVSQIETPFFEYVFRAHRLVFGINSKAPKDELKELKHTYDEAWIQSQATSFANGANLEGIFPAMSSQPVSGRFVELNGLVNTIDACIQQLYFAGHIPEATYATGAITDETRCAITSHLAGLPTDPESALQTLQACGSFLFDAMQATLNRRDVPVSKREGEVDRNSENALNILFCGLPTILPRAHAATQRTEPHS